MQNINEVLHNYSSRSSFMLYAEIALMQGLPIDEVIKKLRSMEMELAQDGSAKFEVHLKDGHINGEG